MSTSWIGWSSLRVPERNANTASSWILRAARGPAWRRSMQPAAATGWSSTGGRPSPSTRRRCGRTFPMLRSRLGCWQPLRVSSTWSSSPLKMPRCGTRRYRAWDVFDARPSRGPLLSRHAPARRQGQVVLRCSAGARHCGTADSGSCSDLQFSRRRRRK